jgi:hypothetical protein
MQSRKETMGSHWLFKQLSTKLATYADADIFSSRGENIKHDRYFPQGLERLNPHENYPHTRETC